MQLRAPQRSARGVRAGPPEEGARGGCVLGENEAPAGTAQRSPNTGSRCTTCKGVWGSLLNLFLLKTSIHATSGHSPTHWTRHHALLVRSMSPRPDLPGPQHPSRSDPTQVPPIGTPSNDNCIHFITDTLLCGHALYSLLFLEASHYHDHTDLSQPSGPQSSGCSVSDDS